MSGPVRDDPEPPIESARSRTPAGRLISALMHAPTTLIFAVSLVIALLLLWRQGTLADLGAAASHANRSTVVGAIALYVVGGALLCLRWHVLVRMIAGRSDAPRAAQAFLTSVMLNYAAPIGLAIPARAALTKRGLGLSVAETGAIALWEVATDVLVLGLAGAVWLAFGNTAVLARLPGTGPEAWALVVLALGLAVAAALLVAWRRPNLRRRGTVAGLTVLRFPARRPGDAALALGVTLGFWALQGIILGTLLDAVGIAGATDPGLVVGLLALPVLVGMLSPVPGGAGVREALMVAVAQARHLNGAAVLLAAVAYRVALFVAIPILFAIVRGWLAVRERNHATTRHEGRSVG